MERRFLVELSDLEHCGDKFKCPECRNWTLVLGIEYRDVEGDTLYWDAYCSSCGRKFRVFND